jgi:hypothetical protein
MPQTIFQKIIDREIPAKLAHEDEHCIAIHDINPQAPVHVLIIPKKLIPRVGEATAADQPILGHLLLTAAALAQKLGLEKRLPARDQQRARRRRDRAASARASAGQAPARLAAGLSRFTISDLRILLVHRFPRWLGNRNS